MPRDAVDEQIVQELKQNGRLSNKALAQRVGLSESACSDRVKRLERTKIILGYRAVLSASCYGFEGWADIAVSGLSVAVLDSLDNLLAASPSVVRVVCMVGAFDRLVQFVGSGPQEWRAFQDSLASIGVGLDRVRLGIVAQPERAPEFTQERAV